MEIILIFLTGTLMGAFNLGFFFLGYYLRGKKADDEGVAVTDRNGDFIKDMARWRAFNGGVNGNNS